MKSGQGGIHLSPKPVGYNTDLITWQKTSHWTTPNPLIFFINERIMMKGAFPH